MSAQTLQWYWQVDASGASEIQRIARATNGDIYVAGSFRSELDFDPGPGTALLSATPGTNGFLAKFNGNRQLLWVRELSSSDPNVFGMELDAAGNVFLCGFFGGSIDLNPGGSGGQLTAVDGYNAYVAKYSPSGTFQWVRRWGDAESCYIHALDVAPDGTVYAAGQFEDSLDLDPGLGMEIHHSSGMFIRYDAFLVALDANGNYRWGGTWGGAEADFAKGIDVNGDQVTVISQIADSIDLDLGPGVSWYMTPSASVKEMLFLTLDTAGNGRWAKILSTKSVMQYGTLNSDAYGNLYATSQFDGQLDADPGAGTDLLFALHNTCFMVSLTSDGDYRWAASLGGEAYTNSILGCDVSAEGVYFSGRFSDQVDLGGPFASHDYTATGADDAFLLRLGLDGHFGQVQVLGPPQNGANSTRFAWDVAAAGGGSALIGGYYQWGMDIDPGAGYVPLICSDGGGFLAKLGTCEPVHDSAEVHVCTGTYTFGGQTLNTDGIYNHTFTSLYGCDSVVTITLDLNSQLNAGISQQGNALIAAPSGLQYQWIDCANGNTPLPGETQAYLWPSQSGSYACIVSDGSCQDTASCVQLTVVGEAPEQVRSMDIYPNPATDGFMVQTPEPITSIRVIDGNGRLLLSQSKNMGRQEWVNWDVPAGVYWVEARWGRGQRSIGKVVRGK